MSGFNPGLNPTNDPSYDRNAKELNPSDWVAGNYSSREKNLNLFANVAHGVKNAVEGAYKSVVSGIKDTVYEGVDPIRDAQGGGAVVADAEDQASQAVGNKPANPDLSRESISRIHAAFEQGKISETNYYAQLEAMTRSIRSRFPGFREEVDAMVHSVTGITPANALRSSILHDLHSAQEQKDALVKEFKHFETTNAKFLPSDYWERKSSGKPYSQEETYAYVGKQQQADRAIDVRMAELNHTAAENKASSEKAEQAAYDSASDIEGRVMSQLQPFFNEINDRVKSGKPLSEEESNLYTQRFNTYKQAAEQAYRNLFSRELVPGSGRTLGGLVKDKQDNIVKEKMAVFETLGQNLFDPKFGLSEIAARSSKHMMDATTLELQKKYPIMQRLGALNQIGGQSAAAVIEMLKVDQNIQKNISGPILNLLQGEQVDTITGGKTTLNEQMEDLQKADKSADALKTFIELKANLAGRPNLDKGTLENVSKFLFGNPENLTFLSKFNEKSQIEVFSKLASPQVTANMQKLGGEHWRNYSNWVKNSFATVFHTAGTNIADIPNRPYIKVSQDANGHFVVEPTPEGIRMANSAKMKMSPMGNVLYQLEKLNGDNITQAVEKINRGIDMVAPVLKADGHSDVAQQIKNLTRFIAVTDQKNYSTWQFILKSLGDKETTPEDKKQTFGDVPVNFTQPSGDNPRGIYERNTQWTKPGLTDKDFRTNLSSEEETSFKKWVKENNIPFEDSSQSDYDMRGFWKGMQTGDPAAHQAVNNNDHRIHFSDKWKTPYHHSFSRESQWATPDAPTWNDKDQLIDKNGKVIFDERAPKVEGSLSLEEPQKAAEALKNAFAEGESGGNYNRLVNTPTHPNEAPLTTMKIKDVLAYQQGMLDAGNKSSAAGKYQVVSKTLRSLVKEGVVSEDDLYNEDTQEKIADALLERRGLNHFLNGKISLNAFMRQLGNEWEIIKKSKAAYHKTMFELERMKLASN